MMRNVIQESVVSILDSGKRAKIQSSSCAFDKARQGRNLSVAIRAKDQFAVLVGPEQRHVMHVKIAEDEPQLRQCLFLDLTPVANGATWPRQQLAGRKRCKYA